MDTQQLDDRLFNLQLRINALEHALQEEILWRQRWLSQRASGRRDVPIHGWDYECAHDPVCLSKGQHQRLVALQEARERVTERVV